MTEQDVRVLRILSNNRDQLICENGASVIMQCDCFENAAIHHRPMLSFVVCDAIRQANDVHSTNYVQQNYELNVAVHQLCINAH